VSVSKHQILNRLAAIEQDAPLFFGSMPVDDQVLREIFATAMATLSASPLFRSASPEGREASLLATLTHVLLETADLRHRLGAPDDAAHGEAARLLKKVATH
jgi:hypothetical protein